MQYNSNITNEDYKIHKLEDYLNNQSVDNSKMIWNRMCKLNKNQLKAIYQLGKKAIMKEEKSSLVYNLIDLKWIPTKSGEFKKPIETAKEDLLDGFPYNDTNGWITAIEFGASKKEHQLLNELAAQKGISVNDLSTWLTFPDEKRKEIIKEYTPNAIIEETTELPTLNEQKPRFRSSSLVKRSLPKRYEIKKRHVRVIQIPKDDVKNYLKYLYSKDAFLYCQICEQELNVKYEGLYYFEKVQVFDSISIIEKDAVCNHLLLCPVCSIRYQLYKKDSIMMDDLGKKIIHSNTNKSNYITINIQHTKKIEPQIDSITFQKVHLEELQNVMNNSYFY